MRAALRLKVSNEWLSLGDLSRVPVRLNEQELSVIQFCRQWMDGRQEFEFLTSGSTGTPKRIVFHREQLISSAQLTAQALGLKEGFTALICLDTKFIAGTMMIVRCLVTGMNMVITLPSSRPLDGITDEIDFAAFVPLQLITSLEQAPAKLNTLKTVIIGGAPLSEDVIHSLISLTPRFYATYGMTETITHVALQKLNGPDRQDSFQLLPGIQASTDARGCLTLKVPHLGSSPIITNDIVMLLDEKRFRWLGRFDQVINSGGMKVHPEKIEQAADGAFRKLRIHRRFFVAGLPHPRLGEEVALIVEGTGLGREEEKSINTQLAQDLDKYEMPRVILYVPRFLETGTQKIDRLGTVKMLK